MHTGGTTASSITGSRPRTVNRPGARSTSDPTPAIAALICVALGGLVLTRSTISWETLQTALALTLCGLVPAEFVRYQARHASQSVATPWVSTAPVWIIAAALTLPLAAVLLVVAVLHTHELAAGLAGGLYLAVTDGPGLVRAARRRVLGEHLEAGAPADSPARAALGVLL